MYEFAYIDIFKEAWDKMKQHYWKILGVIVIVIAVQIFFKGTIKAMEDSAPLLAFMLSLIFMIVATFLSVGIIRCLLRVVDGKEIEFTELFSGGDIFPVFLMGSIAYTLVVFGGMLLLIVPGIIFSIKYAFVQYLIADKGMGVKEAFKKSGEITQGYKWKLFFFGILASLLMASGALLLGVGLFITLPWTAVTYPIIYRKLSGEIQTETGEEAEAIDIESLDHLE